jgi:Leucine-rich repeat (LRR) protein
MNFDIDLYIFSLPDNTEIINVSNKKLKYLPDLTRFTNLKKLDCRNNDLNILPNLPESLTTLLVMNNKNLIINEIPKNVNCFNCEVSGFDYSEDISNNLI